jgi:aspartyl-tRNA(Asn)/glutamyl-tRNA(Gln) amidotransferase subunit A
MSATSNAELTRLSIADAAANIRRGELSPLELTAAVLDRISATEPVIHAFVTVLADEALAEARQAQQELQSGHDRGPLHGIPIAIKDIIDIAGLPTRCGSESRAGVSPATADARVVKHLREAGAVIVGKTVTHEFAAGVSSPPARNPWDPDRIPGGSSGGSGASVAAGSSLAAMGSDTAGSIRIPAALNGVVGLKPSFGRISCEGVFPLSWSLDTVGPLTRSVRDAEIVFAAIVENGNEVGQPASKDVVTGLRIGVPRSYFFDRLQPDVAASIERAIATLKDLGAETLDVDWPEAAVAAATGFVICRPELASVHAQTLRTTPELLGPVLRARLEAFSLFPAQDYVRALRVRSVIRRSIADLYRQHGLTALVTPTTAATATKTDTLTIAFPDGEEPVHAGFTRLTMPFNTTGQPVLSIPCGFDGDGLPIGLQIVGRPYEEAAIYQIGRALEDALGERPWPGL